METRLCLVDVKVHIRQKYHKHFKKINKENHQKVKHRKKTKNIRKHAFRFQHQQFGIPSLSSSPRASRCLSFSLNKVLLSVLLFEIRFCCPVKSFKVISVFWILASKFRILFSISCIWLFNNSVLSWSWAILSRSCSKERQNNDLNKWRKNFSTNATSQIFYTTVKSNLITSQLI